MVGIGDRTSNNRLHFFLHFLHFGFDESPVGKKLRQPVMRGGWKGEGHGRLEKSVEISTVDTSTYSRYYFAHFKITHTSKTRDWGVQLELDFVDYSYCRDKKLIRTRIRGVKSGALFQ